MRRLRLVAVPLFLFALIITLASCSNIQKLYDKGNYRQVVEKVEKMSSPSQSDLLLQARSFINLGQEEKALESVLIYLLSDDGKDPQGREFAVSIFLDTNTSDRIATMVLDADDGLRARMTLYRAYVNQGDYENAEIMLKKLSTELDFVQYVTLILEAPVSDERILDIFTAWYSGIEESELDSYLTLLSRFSSEVTITEAVAKKFLSLTDVLMMNEYYGSDNICLSTILKIKGNILESLFDKVNARIYWTQAYRLNPDDEELRKKIQ